MIIGVDASRAFLKEPTGTETYSLHITTELIQVAQRRDHRIRLYTNRVPDEGAFPGSEIVEQVQLTFPRLWTHARLALELTRKSPDVFFTPAHVIPYTYTGSSVPTIHDLGFLHFPDTHKWQQRSYLKWSTGHNARRGKKVIVDSMATKEDLVQFYGISEDKVSVVYPGIDPVLQPVHDGATIRKVLAKYRISPPFLLYIGTLQPRKNVDRLIDGFLQVDTGHQLVLAGKRGWLSEPIISKIRNLETSDQERIRLTGFIAPEDKGALISSAAALVYPSLYEGFGFPIVEANFCGTPVLSSNTSSIPEVAGDAALLVDPNDQGAISRGIARILDDDSLRNRLIEDGYVNARRFSWETCAEMTMDVLEAAAG